MQLTEKCGHHCGVKDGYVGHCSCDECHGYISNVAVPLTEESEAPFPDEDELAELQGDLRKESGLWGFTGMTGGML
jgi:hypothetical protein